MMKSSQSLLHQINVLPPPQWTPQLQEKITFENNISRMRRENALDRELVSDVPKCIEECPNTTPKHAPNTTADRGQTREEIGVGSRVPGYPSYLTDSAPSKTGQAAVEKNMVSIFRCPAHRTWPSSRPITFGNVDRSWKFVAEHLPQKHLSFERDTRLP